MKRTKIKVGISTIPPLVIKEKDRYTGFEIDMWEKIASKLKIDTEYIEYDFKNIINAVRNREVDLVIAGITRTSRREKFVDFSFYTLDSSLSILILKHKKLFLKTLREFFLRNYKKILFFLLLLASLIFILSGILWLLETRGGSSIFATPKKDFFESVFFIISAMTNSGFSGNLLLVNLWGRTLLLFSMISGVFLFGVFVASLSSMITFTRIKYYINSYKDLIGKKIATKECTISADELKKVDAELITVKKIEDACDMLKKNKVDAVVFDTPAILYYVKNSKSDNFVVINDDKFSDRTYGFAFPNGSELKDKVNIEILALHESDEYDILYRKWFD